MTLSAMRIRTVLCTALLVLLTVTGVALAKDKRPRKRVFIEQTHIYAPKRVGEFLLESTDYDPRMKYAGASFRYEHSQYPGMRFDLFIYPAGDMPHATALDAGMKDFLRSFDAGVQMKYYSDLEILGRQSFEIARDTAPQATKTPSEPAKQVDAASEEDARKEAAITDALKVRPIVGERVDLRYRMPVSETGEIVPMRSRGYLFYKQLYYFKGRISAAENGTDQTTFETASDLAMRELVPIIRAANVGGCAESVVRINPQDLEKDEDTLMLQILSSFVDTTNRSCFQTTADAENIALAGDRDQYAVITIEYTAADWNQK